MFPYTHCGWSPPLSIWLMFVNVYFRRIIFKKDNCYLTTVLAWMFSVCQEAKIHMLTNTRIWRYDATSNEKNPNKKISNEKISKIKKPKKTQTKKSRTKKYRNKKISEQKNLKMQIYWTSKNLEIISKSWKILCKNRAIIPNQT
jgi:hypothetical protein